MTKKLLAALFYIALVAPPALAADDPAAAVTAIYRLYMKKSVRLEDTPDQLDPRFYSARRKLEIRKLIKACKGKDICLPDADFLINGQDYKITRLQVKTLSQTETSAKVEAEFRNFDTQEHFVFSLVKEKNQWLIDQLEGGDTEVRYTLDEQIKPNP